MTTFTTQDRQDAQRTPLTQEQIDNDKAIGMLRTVLQTVKDEYGETSNMTEELAEAYITLAKLHDCAVLTSKPLNKWLAPKPLTEEEINQIYIRVYNQQHHNQVLALARAIERAHGIGEQDDT